MADLPIFYESRPVGHIEIHAEGPTFIYDPTWLSLRGAFPVSLLMPLSTRPVPPGVFEPWAANLLPEATQLQVVGRHLGAAPEDTIALLSEIGRDTAGALSIGQPGSTEPGGWKPIGSDEALEHILNELPAKPFLLGEEGVSMSLAGVQSKLGAAVDTKGRLCVPHDGAPSTLILKPDSEHLFGGVHNEALCMVLARHCGINAARVTTGLAGKRHYLLVTRYDRIEQNGRWRRQHQEDFCQALGKPPGAKYESSQSGIRGPKLTDMFAVTRNAMRAPDILNLIDYVAFNVLVCNTDAHAKNYAMMISGRGFSLAPMYDVLCAAAWDGITKNLAQKIAGKSRGDHLKRRHWERMARECGLSPPRLVKRVEELAGRVLREVHTAAAEVEAMPGGTHPLLRAFVAAIEARAHNVIAGLTDLSGAADDDENEGAPPPPASSASTASAKAREKTGRTERAPRKTKAPRAKRSGPSKSG